MQKGKTCNNEEFKYLFIDEVQNVEGFESVVQAYAEEGFSVFLTVPLK